LFKLGTHVASYGVFCKNKDRFEGLRYIKNIIKRILVAQMKILPEDLFALPMVLARLPFSSSRITRVTWTPMTRIFQVIRYPP
jgi:hypothetical protein